VIYFFYGGVKGFGMMVSTFFAAIMSARGIDLYSHASNDLVVLWAVKNGKEKEKSVRKPSRWRDNRHK